MTDTDNGDMDRSFAGYMSSFGFVSAIPGMSRLRLF